MASNVRTSVGDSVGDPVGDPAADPWPPSDDVDEFAAPPSVLSALPPVDWHWLAIRDQIVAQPMVRRALGGAAIAVALLMGWWLLRPAAAPPEASIPFIEPTPFGSDAAPQGTTSTVIVHVAGAVWRPGVYSLVAGQRVADAIEAAGGVRRDGDGDSLNLAAPLVDGAQIYVASEGEARSGSGGGGAGATPLVSINMGDRSDLESLPGIGPALAAAIIADREKVGPFSSIDDLLRVRGIGAAKLDGFRDLVQL